MLQPIRMLLVEATFVIVQCQTYYGNSRLAAYPQTYYSDLSPANYYADTDDLRTPRQQPSYAYSNPYLDTFNDNYNPSITSSAGVVNLAQIPDTGALLGTSAKVVHFPFDSKEVPYKVPPSPSSSVTESQSVAGPNVLIQSTGAKKGVYIKDLTLRLSEPLMSAWLDNLISTMKGASCTMKPVKEKTTKLTLFVQPPPHADATKIATDVNASSPEVQVHRISGRVDVAARDSRAEKSSRNAFSAKLYKLGDDKEVVTFDPLNTAQPA
ncbi:uncharacterized protein LOC111264530 [Varroa jacobsoni]|uniref:uncharacterized protein LOC111264530 n=1 Tax=Varroa jacobsoni TaxID=62625 RepID=UPI000BF8750F|nr:uncharacterized protein LOC111264530 [Varroa jacobsoni]